MCLPIFSTIGNAVNIQKFGEFYINKFSEDLKKEGIDGLSKYLIDLINNYNTSIKSLKEIGKLFNE